MNGRGARRCGQSVPRPGTDANAAAPARRWYADGHTSRAPRAFLFLATFGVAEPSLPLLALARLRASGPSVPPRPLCGRRCARRRTTALVRWVDCRNLRPPTSAKRERAKRAPGDCPGRAIAGRRARPQTKSDRAKVPLPLHRSDDRSVFFAWEPCLRPPRRSTHLQSAITLRAAGESSHFLGQFSSIKSRPNSLSLSTNVASRDPLS